MSPFLRSTLLRKFACWALVGICTFTVGCLGGPSGDWNTGSWSSDDLADDQEFRQEVLKSGFPKAASVGLGDAQQSK